MEEIQTVSSGRKDSYFDKILFCVLLGVTFLTPIFFVPVTFISTQFGTSLLFAFGVVLASLVYIVSTLIKGSLDLPKPTKYAIGILALVPVIYILAGVANGFSRMSFLGYTFDNSTVGFIILSFIYLFLVSLFFRNKNRIFYSYLAFVLSSLILAFFLLIRIIFGADTLDFGMFNSITLTTIGSWNSVGIFFGICLLLSLLTHQMLGVSRFMKVLLTIAIILSLFFLSLVNFTVIWNIIGVCSLLFILYRIFTLQGNSSQETSIKSKIKNIPLYPLIVLVISIVFILWGNNLGGYLSNKFSVSNVEVRPSLAVTLDIAKNTLKSRPLFGSGPNTFVTQWLIFKPGDVTSTIFWNTDFTNGIGLIPTFAVTTGIIGVLSWFIFLGFYVYLGIKSLFSKIEDPFVKYLLTSSFFVSLYLWIMSFVYVPSTVIFILTFFFTGLFFASVYLGGFVLIDKKTFGTNPRTGFVSSLFLVSFFVAGLVLGYGLFRNSLSLWYFQKSSHALNKVGDVQSSEDYMVKAIDSVPYDVYYRALSEIEIVKLNRVASQDPKQVKQEEIQKQFSDTLANAIKAGIAAKDADGSNYLNWIALGRVYEAVSAPTLQIDGAYESGQFAYNEALRRNPKNPGILVLLSRIAVTRGDLKQARNYALQAIQTKQNYLDAYFLLTQIEVADNNLKGAIDAVTASSVINPTDAGIFFQLGLLKYNTRDFDGAIEALEKAVALTPDYANAKYFLGLSYEITGEHQKAIDQFEDIKVTNPDNKDVETILSNLKANKPVFTDAENSKPEKGKTLPVR